MGTVSEDLKSVAGATFSGPEEKGEYDAEGNACATFDELEQWLVIRDTTATFTEALGPFRWPSSARASLAPKASQQGAGRHDVVTPYSSMIVLVNDAQQQALARAQAEQNRFDRDHETGTETLPKPNNPLSASATPEPEEWLMLIVSTAAAAWMWKTRRRRSPAAAAPY